MKVLNLDGFAQVKRQMTLKGVNHDVLETSVQQFIDNLAAAAPNIKSAPEKVAARFNDTQFWQDQTDRCLSCGACTYFCPTCYCFTITDEGEGLSEKGGRRLRSWDNCMSSLFTREASGHNPRTVKAFRMRNRVSHKYSTYPENWGAFSCSGCGRCISNCPVCLDIRAIVLAALEAKQPKAE